MKIIENPTLGWLYAVLRELPFQLNWDNGPWVAGGAVRRFMANETLNGADVDVFCSSAEQFDDVCFAIEKTLQVKKECEFFDVIPACGSARPTPSPPRSAAP